MAFDPEKIETKIDRTAIAGIELDSSRFGLEIKNMAELQEVAKTMCLAKQALPLYLRNEPGLCFAILMRSTRWGIDPFFVAEQSYLVTNPKSGEEKIAFMAQLFNAIINKAEPLILEGKLRIRYEGDGDDMFGIVYGIPKRETEPLEIKTPTLGKRKKDIGFNDRGNFKGSPLYLQDPEQALWYYGSRTFIRRYFPHVLAGCYSQEEMQDAGWAMKDVTPQQDQRETKTAVATLADRLKEKRQATTKTGQSRGFDPAHIEREHAKINGGSNEGAAEGGVVTEEKEDGGKAESNDVAAGVVDRVQDDRSDTADRGGNQTDVEDGSGGGDQTARSAEDGPAGNDAAQASGGQQQELLPPEPKDDGRKRRTK
jgi:hypothetical protein